MEFDTLKVAPWNAPSQGPARELTALDLVDCFTQGMANVAAEILDRFARPPLVSAAADAALWERFQQRRATALQPPATKSARTGRISAFHSGRSTGWSEQQSGWSTSQNRHSQSHPQDEVDSKKGWTEEGTSKSCKVQVGIDWANTGIQKPTLKPNPQHPSFKPDPSRATDSPLPPQIKSSVTARGSHWQSSHSKGCRTTTLASQGAPQENKEHKGDSKVSGLGLAKFLGDPEKREVKDKSYDWITRRMNRLDPKGYVEEIYSFWHFRRNSKSFALEIIAIADWGQRYMELGFNYPITMFPNYLFN